MRKLILTLLLIIPFLLNAQFTGELKGIVYEHGGQIPLPFAPVMVQQNGNIISGCYTDMDGNYSIKNLDPGKYSVKVTCVGLKAWQNDSITITAGRIKTLNITMTESEVELKEYVLSNRHYRSCDISINACTVSGKHSAGNIRKKNKAPKIFAKGIKNKKKKNKGTTNTEVYKGIVENRFANTANDALSTFSIDVDRASYSNIRRMITQNIVPQEDAIRLEEMINYFHYDYPQPNDQHPFSINMETSSCPWNKDHHLILVGLQGKEHSFEQIPPSNLVFLIDVSGSMQGENRLPLVKSSLKALVNQLRPVDKVSIVVYADAEGLVLSPTSGDNKQAIIAAIDNLNAGGSTAGGAGINLAYDLAEKNYDKNANNRIILCTDGDFNVGISSETELENLIVSKRDKGIYITALGYGMGNYKDNFLEIIADKGNGNYAYIDHQQEAEKVLVKEMGATLFTIAKDVKIQVEFNPANIKSYRLLGYENRILQDWEFADDKRDAGEIGSGHTVTAIYEVELVRNNDVPQTDLKYQSSTIHPELGNELMTIKFRYKLPKSNKSILIERVLENTGIHEFETASENLRFASSVAGFGMVLRNSEFKGNLDHDLVLAMAQKALGKDPDGYRKEFIELVETSKKIQRKVN